MRCSLVMVAALSLLACGTGRPFARQARVWNGNGPEERSWARTTIAAAIEAPADPPAPPPAPPALPARAALATEAPKGRPAIRLYTDDGADCPTEALGVVHERALDGNEDAALERIKASAARLGADAVVGYHTINGAGSELDLAGVAVRCQKLTDDDKPYDTIGTIDVPAPPGGEQAAFDELLDRAAKMHANFVVDVHLAPADDGAGRRVVGAAIRYK
jgi:uncharacterized protein YbjQ (UPF0145 family)